MPQIDGQLKGAQLEEISGASTTPACRSRLYSNIADTANAKMMFHTGTTWRALKTSHSEYTSKTANYTATTSDDIIDCDATSAGFTVTLPTAVGNSGKEFTIVKLDSSTNVVTVDGNSSETINGSTTYLLKKQYEMVKIASDGANWKITSRTLSNDDYLAKSGNYTATNKDKFITVDASGASRTITLPAASSNAGLVLKIKKIDSSSNTVVIDGNASETIDGDTTYTLYRQYEYIEIICDGSNWHIANLDYGKLAYRIKSDTSTYNTTTTVSGVTFSGLVSGRTYKVSCRVIFHDQSATTSNDFIAYLRHNSGGTNLLLFHYRGDVGSNGFAIQNGSTIFVAANTDITFVITNVQSASVAIEGVEVIVEEVPNLKASTSL